MRKTVSYSKLSKKKKREQNKLHRGTWGGIRPTTRKKENAKAYNRKENRRRTDDPNGGFPFFLLCC
jgi:hypothetical protein